jgi:Holliday junction DNA helicase RuvA
MIAFVEGSLAAVEENAVVLQMGGMGVRVFVPKTVLEDVGSIGRKLRLFTHLLVRETELTLYGFMEKDDLRLFETLITVNGIGPKLAQTILSTLSPELVRSAVLQKEAVILQRVPGIGKKTAERILFSLRDKLDFRQATATPLVSDVDADVVDVLTSLGFSIVEAQAALQKLPRDVQSTEERVALALQFLDPA